MPYDDKNVLGGALAPCSTSPRTGFYRDGCCNTGPEDVAGPNANARLQELARRVAEAHIDMRRVRDARHQLLSNALSDPYYDS